MKESLFTRRDFLKFSLPAAAGLAACQVFPEKKSLIIEPTPQVPPPSTILPEAGEVDQSKEGENKIVWKQEMVVARHPLYKFTLYRGFCTQEDKVFLTNFDGYATAIDVTSGNQIWQWREDKGLVYGNDEKNIYVTRPDHRLCALDLQTGKLKWEMPFAANQTRDWPVFVGQEEMLHKKDTLYLPCRGIKGPEEGNFFIAVDRETGRFLWQSKDYSKIYSVTDQTLLVASGPHYAINWYGLDPRTGQEKWRSSLPDLWSPQDPSVVSKDLFFFPLGTKKGDVLVAANIDSGKILWQSEKTGLVSSYSSIPNYRRRTLSEIAIYAMGFEDQEHMQGRFLTAIDRKTGKELWSRDFGDYDRYIVDEFRQLIILSDPLSSERRYISAVSTLTGKEIWRNNDFSLLEAAGIVKETLVGGCYPSSGKTDLGIGGTTLAFGLDIKTGEQKWQLTHDQSSLPMAFGDKIIFTTRDAQDKHLLSILHPETGQLLSLVPLPEAPWSQVYVFRKGVLVADTGPSVSREILWDWTTWRPQQWKHTLCGIKL